jgi:hypothetical protein
MARNGVSREALQLIETRLFVLFFSPYKMSILTAGKVITQEDRGDDIAFLERC